MSCSLLSLVGIVWDRRNIDVWRFIYEFPIKANPGVIYEARATRAEILETPARYVASMARIRPAYLARRYIARI